MDFFVDSLLRWAHILSGSVWLGFSMFFLLAASPAKLPVAQVRAGMWWMRMAATKSMLLGLGLFYWSYMHMEVGKGTGRTKFIMYGMMFAIGMWCVLWFVIWPAQKKILAAREQGADAPESAVRRAALFSKLNGMMIGPMLLLMIFAHNYTTFSYSMLGLIMVMGISVMGAIFKAAEILNRRQS